MDKNPLMKGLFIVMDNAPIHTHKDIDELITSRGYRSTYLPHYSPELNPIEQFWSVVKNKVKRGVFSDNEDLKTRIAEACNNIPIHHLKAFIQHSCNQFDKCRNKEPHLMISFHESMFRINPQFAFKENCKLMFKKPQLDF